MAGDGDLPAAVRDGVLLLVTELVNNAVRHAKIGPEQSLRVGVWLSPRRVRVEVVDPGTGFTRIRAPSRRDESGGWGLVLVDRIADRWGVARAAAGTCVWFEIRSDVSATRKATIAIEAAPGTEGPSWRDALAPYARPHLGRSLLDIATSVVPYLALSVLMYLALDVSYLLVLALAIPAAGFLLRTYIVFHDCAHGSFLPSKRANAWLGVALGLVVYAPFVSWRHSHAVHHATAGDLDRRGVGDVLTLTVAEYRASPWRRRLGYRLFRNPLVMFGLGPIYATAPAAAPGLPIGAPAHPAQRDRDEHRARGAGGRRCAGWWGGASSCSCRCRPHCSRARRACGCSTSSTSSRTPTGRAPATGATPTRRCGAAAT